MSRGFFAKRLTSVGSMAMAIALFTLGILPAAASGQVTTAAADTATWHGSDWRFGIGLYGWLLSVHGDLKSPDGTDYEFTLPFSDILERIQFVIMAVGEVNYRNWFVVFDGMWATLEGDRQGQVFDLDVEVKQQIFDVHGGYGVFKQERPVESKPGKKPWRRVSVVDVILGARYFGTKTTLTETTDATGRVNTTETDVSRWDPFFGARGSYSFADRWAGVLSLDIGGFGIGDAAQFTYQVDANVVFRISHPIAVCLGYRVLAYDMEDDAQDWTDITQYGPKIAVSATF